MRPSLLRLLQRPAAVDLLRVLIHTPTLEALPPVAFRKCCRSRTTGRRAIASSARLGAKSTDKHPPATSLDDPVEDLVRLDDNESWKDATIYSEIKVPWLQGLSDEDLAFESALSTPNTSDRVRLADQKQYQHQPVLWAALLQYQQKEHGAQGVAMIWRAMRERKVEILPESTPRVVPNMVWSILIREGLQHDSELLKEVVEYADDLAIHRKQSWVKLYVKIVSYQLIHNPSAALSWHERLYDLHPPNLYSYRKLFMKTIELGGDLSTLAEIWKAIPVKHPIYEKIIPYLCLNGQFDEARKWHWRLVNARVKGRSVRHAQPLITYLRAQNPTEARRVLRSLGASDYESSMESSDGPPRKPPSRKLVTTREVMNQTHAQTFGVKVAPVMKYDDHKGARWLATQWLSLDLIYTGLQARAVKEIGPLSLQAIGLRAKEPAEVVKQIRRLRDFGISIDSSMYSRGIEHLALKGDAELLTLLLTSDQHPYNFNNRKLQEKMMVSHAESNEVSKFKLCLEMTCIMAKDPESARENTLLRFYINQFDTSKIYLQLQQMMANRIAVSRSSIRYLLENCLPKREPGKGPTANDTGRLAELVVILRKLVDAGTEVPIFSWREIFTRLGMTGRLRDLHQLAFQLASRAQDKAEKRMIDPEEMTFLRQDILRRKDRSGLYIDRMLTRYNEHIQEMYELQILFPPSLQGAIVYWGFRHALLSLKGKPELTYRPDKPGSTYQYSEGGLPPFTTGLVILRDLKKLGVVVDIDRIRTTVCLRLLVLYGRGQLMSKRNRELKEKNPFTIHEMYDWVHKAWGEEFLPPVPAVVGMMNSRRLRRKLKAHANNGLLLFKPEAETKQGQLEVLSRSQSWAGQLFGDDIEQDLETLKAAAAGDVKINKMLQDRFLESSGWQLKAPSIEGAFLSEQYPSLPSPGPDDAHDDDRPPTDRPRWISSIVDGYSIREVDPVGEIEDYDEMDEMEELNNLRELSEYDESIDLDQDLEPTKEPIRKYSQSH